MSMDDIKTDPEGAILKLAAEQDAVVLLKGSTTFVAEPTARDAKPSEHSTDEKMQSTERRLFTVDRGCPGMATAGSGDVLSGILSALCVNTEDLTLATAAGAYINGLAGEIAQSKRSDITMTSADTAMSIAEAIESIKN